MNENTSGVPQPFTVPWPRPSLSLVLTELMASAEWSDAVSSRLEDLAAQQGVEVILPVDRYLSFQAAVPRPVSVVECPEGTPEAELCPRLRGVARAVGNVIVFRAVGGTNGRLLGLPPLWEPCPPPTMDLGARLQEAGVEPPPVPPPAG